VKGHKKSPGVASATRLSYKLSHANSNRPENIPHNIRGESYRHNRGRRSFVRFSHDPERRSEGQGGHGWHQGGPPFVPY
jgi:hypothetical protein